MAGPKRWSESETKRALYLYFQLPFGQIHSGNHEIIALADQLRRTPSSIAMKLANFASLDPEISKTGRKGIQGTSALDRKVWDEFHNDWTRLVLEAESEEEPTTSVNRVRESDITFIRELPSGATTMRAEVEQRVGQNFFRRAVLANFDNVCCVTGIAEPQLLSASHISPWRSDIANRHNPRNGLCLSATFDRAFDRHLMAITPEFTVRLSSRLLFNKSAETRAFFAPFEGRTLRQPTHVVPDFTFLRQHAANFVA
jgi:putative restriction endonuclease